MGMYIPRKTANGTTMVPIESQAFEQRTIYIDGEINEQQSLDVFKQILELNRQDQYEPIKLIISSPGGSVIHGLAIYDAIVSSKAPVYTYCVGTAYSMGAIIFMAGEKRYILENSKVMLHAPLVGQNNGGNTASITSLAESLKSTQDQLVEIICRHTGMSKKNANKDISYDHFYTSKQAVEAHIADEIVGLNEII